MMAQGRAQRPCESYAAQIGVGTGAGLRYSTDIYNAKKSRFLPRLFFLCCAYGWLKLC